MARSGAVSGAIFGLLAAALFGASTPFAKLLLPGFGPLSLAGFLYLGAGLALSVVRLIRGRIRPRTEVGLRRSDLLPLGGIIVLGGVVGPVLMLVGLSRISGVASALLLNLEAPLTITVAIVAFGEHLGFRETLSAAVIVLGATVLAYAPGALGLDAIGVLAIAGACLAWAIDNNLTQRLSARDPVELVQLKTLSAGILNTGLALSLGQAPPAPTAALIALVLGSLSYGASILLDAYALRLLGAAREAAYFATAPFLGAALAIPLLDERPSISALAGGALMVLGVVLLFRARHQHLHVHEAIEHEHLHVHDEHHQHAHEGPVSEPHAHPHRHAALVHDHPHVSDVHHRHRHG
jgi:drug/metabolite transporter (DMT)-like permease